LTEVFGVRDMTFLFKLLDGTYHHWDYKNLANVLQLNGRVRVLIDPEEFHEKHIEFEYEMEKELEKDFEEEIEIQEQDKGLN
jgi:hypothetical protein